MLQPLFNISKKAVNVIGRPKSALVHDWVRYLCMLNGSLAAQQYVMQYFEKMRFPTPSGEKKVASFSEFRVGETCFHLLMIDVSKLTLTLLVSFSLPSSPSLYARRDERQVHRMDEGRALPPHRVWSDGAARQLSGRLCRRESAERVEKDSDGRCRGGGLCARPDRFCTLSLCLRRQGCSPVPLRLRQPPSPAFWADGFG